MRTPTDHGYGLFHDPSLMGQNGRPTVGVLTRGGVMFTHPAATPGPGTGVGVPESTPANTYTVQYG